MCVYVCMVHLVFDLEVCACVCVCVCVFVSAVLGCDSTDGYSRQTTLWICLFSLRFIFNPTNIQSVSQLVSQSVSAMDSCPFSVTLLYENQFFGSSIRRYLEEIELCHQKRGSCQHFFAP